MLLAEYMYILSINPKNNQPYIRTSSSLLYSLSGALIAELLLEDMIKLNEHDKIELVDTNVNNSLLAETLGCLRTKANKKMTYWVPKIKNKIKRLDKRIAYQLEDKEMGYVQDSKFLGIFSNFRFQINNEIYINRSRDIFRSIVKKIAEHQLLTKEEEKMVILFSLVHVNNLLDIIFPDKKEAKKMKKFIKNTNKNLPVSKAVEATIASINMAVIAAVSASSTHSSSS